MAVVINKPRSAVVHKLQKRSGFSFSKPNTTEIVGVFARLLQKWDGDIKLIRLEDNTIVKVPDPGDELRADYTYRFHGFWKNHPKYGKQFHADSFAGDAPITKRGTVLYLADVCDHIGNVTACKLWDRFGEKTLETVRDNPQAIADAGILDLDKAKEAADCLKFEGDTQRTKIDLLGLFKGHGLGERAIQAALMKWGSNAGQVVRRDPFKLMVSGVPGAGYVRCDRLYQEMGLPLRRLKRQMLKAWYELNNDKAGHTWFGMDTVKDVNQRAITLGIRAGWLVVREDETGRKWITERTKAAAEAALASNLARLASWRPSVGDQSRTNWPDVSVIENISDHQREELAKAFSSPVAVLAGCPGTGKTYCAAAAIRALSKLGGFKFYVCAPTGKAAVRVQESLMKASGMAVEAKTIHSLIGITPGDDDAEIRPTAQLEGFVIVDETSMVDVPLMARLLAACRTGTHILFLGDPYQLPPVGHGAPLRDLLQSDQVTTGELSEIQRNAGQIVKACKAIKEGQRFEVSEEKYVRGSAENLRMIEARPGPESADDVVAGVLRMVEIVPRYEFHPVWDTQVLVAVNTKGKCCRVALNKLLQQKLNPDGYTIPNHPFRVGDKIICLKNNMAKLVKSKFIEVGESPTESRDARDYADSPREIAGVPVNEVYIANGELGRVIAVAVNQTIAQFDGPTRMVRILHGGNSGEKEKKAKKEEEKASDDLPLLDPTSGTTPTTEAEPEPEEEEQSTSNLYYDLGYAITTHKCVSPDTLVETEEGLLPICEIASSGTIASVTGEAEYMNPVSYPMATCQNIITEDGHELIASDEHKCEVWDGQQWVLVPASLMLPGMWVRQKLGATVEPKRSVMLPQVRPGHHANPVTLPTVMTDELAEFFGLLVADGTIFRGGVRLVKAQFETVDRFAVLASRLFRIAKPEPSHTEGKITGWWTAEIHSQHLALWLNTLGGMSSNAKSVPRCILQSPSSVHAHFLRGLFEDGSVHVKGDKLDHINWTTCYPRLAQTVKVMLLRLSVVCSVNSQRKRQDSIYIYSNYAKRFGEVVGFISKEKQRRVVLPAYGTDESTRQRIPVCVEQVSAHRSELRARIGASNTSNAIQRGYMSRATATKFPGSSCGNDDFPSWHYSRVKSVEPCQSPVMCVEVPSQGRFLQNGFPWSNSQGSEAPCVIVVIDPLGRAICTREHLYTSISRAKDLCLLVGKRSVADEFCRRVALNRRKTFLVSLLNTLSRPITAVHCPDGSSVVRDAGEGFSNHNLEEI